MRVYLVLIALLSFQLQGQTIQETRSDLAKVITVENARNYLSNHPNVKGKVFKIDAGIDTAAIYKQMFMTAPGDIVELNMDKDGVYHIFKILEKSEVKFYRVQYIFLDNRKWSLEQIDSLRRVILKRLNDGDSFDILAAEYSMDGNSKNGGDLGWFEEASMMKEFVDEIKRNPLGKVFTVDIPSEKWYYLVKNTHVPRVDERATLLYIEVKL